MTDLKSLFLLDPGVTFLNHGSYGAVPRPVYEAWQELQRQSEAQPVAWHNPWKQAELHRRSRGALAAELGADPFDLVAQVNATQALNLVLQGLDLGPGDEILTTDHEYAALEKTWDHVCRKTGAVLRKVIVPLPLVDEKAFTDTVLAGFTARTRVLFLSHITSPTALWLPIAAVLAEARARGILTIVDGAHAPGQIPLDLTALGADIYAGNCHKWLMAPKGSAFLHVRRDLQDRIVPLVISHGWQAEPAATGPFGNPAFLDRLEMQGTRDSTAWFAVPAALEFRSRNDWWQVIARCRDMARETAARIGAITGLDPIAAPEFCAPQMVSIPIPRCAAPALHDHLLAEFGIEIPVIDWAGRNFVRVSVQGYTAQADLDRLVSAARALWGGATPG